LPEHKDEAAGREGEELKEALEGATVRRRWGGCACGVGRGGGGELDERMRRKAREEYGASERYRTLLLNEKLETLLSECNISRDSFGGNISSP
jgi:hypothetical protein